MRRRQLQFNDSRQSYVTTMSYLLTVAIGATLVACGKATTDLVTTPATLDSQEGRSRRVQDAGDKQEARDRQGSGNAQPTVTTRDSSSDSATTIKTEVTETQINKPDSATSTESGAPDVSSNAASNVPPIMTHDVAVAPQSSVPAETAPAQLATATAVPAQSGTLNPAPPSQTSTSVSITPGGQMSRASTGFLRLWDERRFDSMIFDVTGNQNFLFIRRFDSIEIRDLAALDRPYRHIQLDRAAYIDTSGDDNFKLEFLFAITDCP